jgi:hypothetical protein
MQLRRLGKRALAADLVRDEPSPKRHEPRQEVTPTVMLEHQLVSVEGPADPASW